MRCLRYIFALFLLFSSFGVWAENAYVDLPVGATRTVSSLATYLKSHYQSDKERLWALYSWEAGHIKYNYESMGQQHKMTKEMELAQWTLDNRVGVCANFAQLFYSVARLMGVECYLVPGYVVTENRVRDNGHEWCACIIQGKPYIFDPTWGGGYLLNNVQYVPKLNPDFFMVSPERMVLTHMPEDPMFQFLDYPISYDEIDNPGATTPIRTYFSWRDTLDSYMMQDTLLRLEGKIRRMKNNGFANDWVVKQIGIYTYNLSVYTYNRQANLFNDLVSRFNNLVSYVNSDFKPLHTKTNVVAELDALRAICLDISSNLDSVGSLSESLDASVLSMQKSIELMMPDLDKLEKVILDHFNRK